MSLGKLVVSVNLLNLPHEPRGVYFTSSVMGVFTVVSDGPLTPVAAVFFDIKQ